MPLGTTWDHSLAWLPQGWYKTLIFIVVASLMGMGIDGLTTGVSDYSRLYR
jgi:hypothetical protein